ncbi:Transcription-repair-coupling factor [bioreactor metagenome]|uniref:Transcription-repair-coupling factor n=1 Tax=bioreactor metagenome TaxID=1076179 RepID=A0A645IWX4_9ZZZZ
MGFNLYCQLLKATISQLRGEAVESTRDCNVYIDFIDYSLKTKSGKLSAAFPEEYINAPRLRLEAYRRLAGIRNRAELESFEKELVDRFGALPDMAVTLIRCTRIRVMGIEAGVNSISLNGDKIIVEKGIEILKQEGKIPRVGRSISLMDKLLGMECIVSNMFFYKK